MVGNAFTGVFGYLNSVLKNLVMRLDQNHGTRFVVSGLRRRQREKSGRALLHMEVTGTTTSVYICRKTSLINLQLICQNDGPTDHWNA